MSGVDWVYSQLMELALAHSPKMVKERASQFRKEVLEECWTKALVQIDWHPNSPKLYAHKTVRDVCIELVRQ